MLPRGRRVQLRGPETIYPEFRESVVSPSYERTKRLLDLLIGSVGLAVALLAGIGLVPLIRRRSPGAPAIFRQTRIGQDGKPFTLYKFRTMEADAEARREDVLPLNEVEGPVFKMDHDPRGVDRLRWLRKYSLDELPQFWNVVKGDMAIVGPRPPLPEEVAQYTDYQRHDWRSNRG